MATYPGNPETLFEEQRGATSVCTKLTLGTHTGTHIDAPRHIFEKGMSIDHMPLEAFVGTCRVLDMTHCEEAIYKKDLVEKQIDAGERILLKTKNSFSDQDVFVDRYIYVDGEAADFLAELNIQLLGIDALSIKQRGGKDYRAHASLLEKNIPIVEGLSLQAIPEGAYLFIGLPLCLQGVDGSPVRAVLIEEYHSFVTK